LSVPIKHEIAVRVISVVVLAVSGTLWLHDTVDLLFFAVAIFGRLPIITPVWVYAAVMLSCGAMVVPPMVAVFASDTPVLRPSLVTAVMFVAVVVCGTIAYRSPAYTNAQPQRRAARVITDATGSSAIYEVASQEPGLDLHEGAPGGWTRVSDAPSSQAPFARLPQPFVFRTTAPGPGPAPATVGSFTLRAVPGGTELSLTVTPSTPGLAVAFVLPPGMRPSRTNLPGVMVGDRWRATFVAVPAEGVTWRASFGTGHDTALADTRVVAISSRFPGGSGWQSLPPWLPQDEAVWHLDVAWVVVPPAPIAPVPPLR
jgi:hypothetical protein